MKVFKSEQGKACVLESYDKIASLFGVAAEEKCIETQFGKTHVFLCGDRKNPPLLMFHGVGDNSAVMWALNMYELSKHFFCIAIDTIGGPGKSEPNTHYNKKEFNQVKWINEIADKMELRKFYIVGVSYGACIAYLYTVYESARVLKAVCIEGGMITKPLKSMISTLMLAFPEVLFPTERNLVKIIKKMKPGSDLFDKHPEIIKHMVLVMKNHNQAAMFPHRLEKYNIDQGLAVRDKLYFLFGGNMQAARDEYMEMLNEGQFRYKIIEGAGHGVNHEKPEQTHNEILSFLLR